jgi:exoribonuclease II
LTAPVPGTVIEYYDGDRHHLGYVLETGRSLLVVTPAGAQPRISNKSITHERILSWPDDLATQDARDQLIALERRVCGLVAGAGVEEAWELLRASGESSVSPPYLAELVFGRVDPATQLATDRLLRKHPAWFKRGDDVLIPRPRDQVDDLLRQAEGRARAEASRKAFAHAVIGIARRGTAPRSERAASTGELCADPAARDRVDLLESYAIMGDEAPRARAAISLLDLLASDGVQLRSRGAGRAFHLLTDLGVFGVHENLTLRRRGALVEFTEAELAAADAPPLLDGWDHQRRDLRDLEVFTIDGAGTRDIDDALSVEYREGGGFQIGIHITDPAAVIAHDSPLDLIARARGTSIYLPSGVIPMLPPSLSEAALSLVPGADRPALSFLVDYDAEGEPSGYAIELTQIRSQRQLTYAEVDEILVTGADPLSSKLETLDAVAVGRMETRLDVGGGVLFEIPETKVRPRWKDGAGEELAGVIVETIQDTPGRVLVRELMILAGELAADFCDNHKVPVLYRAQSPPDDQAQEAALSGRKLDILDALAARRHMRRAELAMEPAGHFGLGVPSYVQATSPIRRYGDLLCHRQIAATVRGESPPISREELVVLAAQIEALCGDASVVERERRRYWGLVHLRAFKREPLDAVVFDFADDRKQRAVVLIDEGLTQGVVPVRRGQIAVGTRVKVKIESLNPRRNVLALSLVT